MSNNYPKLHNATWPGVVGKGPDTPEEIIDLDTMIELTAAAEVSNCSMVAMPTCRVVTSFCDTT